MQQTGSKQETLEAWADIVEKIWREKIVAMKVWETGDLYRSILNHLLIQSGGDVAKIEFLFRKYGLYVNASKPWFKDFYRQLYRLVEILREKFALEAADYLATSINSINNEIDSKSAASPTASKVQKNIRQQKMHAFT